MKIGERIQTGMDGNRRSCSPLYVEMHKLTESGLRQSDDADEHPGTWPRSELLKIVWTRLPAIVDPHGPSNTACHVLAILLYGR